MSGFRLAVDFGTTHTVAMLSEPTGRVRSLLFDGSPLLQSAVLAAADGRLHAGIDAVRLSAVDPGAFEPNPKARIDEATVLLGTWEVAVVDLIAAVLSRVREEAVRTADGPIVECVLTHPAAWGARRREVLAEGARRAGLTGPAGGPVSGLASGCFLAEPLAAAAYFTEVVGQRVLPGQPLAVFDFGGGTLDIAVTRRSATGFEVVGVGGLDDLGGRDLDAVAVGLIGAAVRARDPRAWHRLVAPTTPEDQQDRLLLWQEARQAKEMLSRAPFAPVHVPGSPVGVHLTREEFEQAAAPLVDRGIEETVRVLAAAGVTPAELVGVFLVGGASRVPMVAQRLHRRLGVAPTVLEQPETVVAAGAVHWPVRPVAPAVAVPGLPGASASGPAPASASGPAPASESEGFAAPTSMVAPSAPGRPAGRRRRVLLGAVIALVLVVAAATGVLLYVRAQPSDQSVASPSASQTPVDPALMAASMPTKVQDIAKPWLPLLRACSEPKPAWFSAFESASELGTAVHCSVRTTVDTESAGITGVSFFAFGSDGVRTAFRKSIDKNSDSGVEPPAGVRVGMVREILAQGKGNIKVAPATCVLYWDSTTTLGVGVLASSSGIACASDTIKSLWRARVTSS